MLKKSFAAFAVASVAMFGLPSAQANTITSNDLDCTGAPLTRVFSVTATTVEKCLMKGTGNLSGNPAGANPDPFLASVVGTDWILIDKSDDTTSGAHDGWLSGTPALIGGTSGSFTINALAFSTYDKIAIAFKTGEGQIDPDFAIFLLADGTLSGTWSVTGNQALSHANIYGFGDGGTPDTEVPEPGSLALVGLALVAAGSGLRRRRG